MIFFNIPEARDQLMEKGLVYTLRSSFRAVGRTRAVAGGYSKHTFLCRVFITKVTTIKSPDELHPYVEYSGFKSVEAWTSKATPTARTLYKVEKYGEKGEP